ncbi:MAG TPA: hypothetical protein VGB97_03935 [Candidatus Paceibacterota bacterium]
MKFSPTDELRLAVTEIYGELGIPYAAVEPLCCSYSERWRTYHDANHILGMLEGARGLVLMGNELLLLKFLIVSHDRWLKVGREHGESERESARLAIEDLQRRDGERHPPLEELVYQGITATITHTLECVDERFVNIVAPLIDLDLWGLGQDPAYFQSQTEAIWLEYEPRYTRAEYDEGRKMWAATFLERPKIYLTPHFKHLEPQARENLQALALS